MDGHAHVVAPFQPRRQRRFAGGTPHIDGHLARDGGGQPRRAELGDQVQGQVDARRDAGAGAHLAVLDEHAAVQHLGAGRQPAQRVEQAVVGGAAPAIQQAGGAGQQCAGADTGQRPAVAAMLPQPFDQGLAGGRRQHRLAAAGGAANHDQRVLAQLGRQRFDAGEAHAQRGRGGLAALYGRDHPQAHRQPHRRGDPEGIGCAGEIQQDQRRRQHEAHLSDRRGRHRRCECGQSGHPEPVRYAA